MKRILCWLGWHDWRILYWESGHKAHFECYRCGKYRTITYMGQFD